MHSLAELDAAAAGASIPRERLAVALSGFVRWLDRYGDVSQDQYDLWATRPGRLAKNAYYRAPHAALPLVAPFVLLETVWPGVRRYVRRPQSFPIADAHYAMGFFALAEVDGDDAALDRARAFLERLERSRSLGFDDYAWGYPFDWETCFGRFEAGRPLITTIPYCYEAFEDGQRLTGESRYLEIMYSTARFCFERIPCNATGERSAASAYTPRDERRVVNASAYRGFLLTSAGLTFQRDDWLAAAERNIAFVLESQRQDGSWLYAMDGKDAFIDNFHTCFVLKNLFKVCKMTRQADVAVAIERGYDFYRAHLLDERLEPVPFARAPRLRLDSRELYDYAEGINLAWLLRDFHPAAAPLLVRLVDAVLEDWTLQDGHFLTRRGRVRRNTVPYHRWAQSQMFRALAVCYRGT